MSPARKLSDRHPFEIYLLVWAFATSAPGALGVTAVPPSIASQMPDPWPRLWVVGLAFGTAVALAGLAWKRPPWPKITVTGLLVEQVGLVITGSSTILYAWAVLTFSGSASLVPAGIVVAFGLACFTQALRIRNLLARSRATS